MSITFNDVAKFISENSVQPSKLFQFDAIKEDVKFNKQFVESEKIRLEITTNLEEEKKAKEELSKKLTDSISKVNMYEKPTIFNSMIKNGKFTLTENEKMFIEKSLDNLSGEINEATITKFVETKQQDYKLFQQINNDVVDDVPNIANTPLPTSKDNSNIDDEFNFV